MRHEIQFHREVLRSLNCYEYPAILDRLGDLWRYANGDWLRLTVPQAGDINKSRWPNHSLWDALLSICWDDPSPARLERLKPIARVPRDGRTYASQFSVLSSFMAAKSIEDPTQAMVKLFDEMRQHYDDALHLKGSSFDQGILERAARKAKEFGVYFTTCGSVQNKATDCGAFECGCDGSAHRMSGRASRLCLHLSGKARDVGGNKSLEKGVTAGRD